MKFSDRYLQSIKAPEKEYCVREGHGFTLRVLPSGLKIFQYIYTIKGKRHRLNLGHYPHVTLSEAREKFHAASSQVAKGINPLTPLAEEPENTQTVSDLIDLYKKFSKQNNEDSTSKETARTLDKYVLPSWKDRNIKEIRRRDAIELIEPLAKTAPGQARGVMKIARAMFNYALDRELVEMNPFTRLPKAVPAVKPASRSRVLTDEEIKAAWDFLHAKNAPGTPECRRAILLVLVTGQRPVEVSGMTWEEIDEDWWTISSERIKTRNRRTEDHRVYLSPLAKQLIGENPKVSNYVFYGSSLKKPILRSAMSHLICEETKGGRSDGKGTISVVREKYFGLSRWTPHDLRRTASTKLAELGCLDEYVDAILNHAKDGVIGIYNRYKYEKEKQEWLTKWGDHLKNLVNPSEPHNE